MSDMQKLILKGTYLLPDDTPLTPEAKDLLSRILDKNPDTRLSLSDIFLHPWLLSDKLDPLFFDQERAYIKHSFTYDTHPNRNEPGNLLNSSDIFPEHLLDTQQLNNNDEDNDINNENNHSTKSIILAPFNSTISHLDPTPHSPTSDLQSPAIELLTKSRVFKFKGQVRELDRQYEMNNNAALDNGIYHKLLL
jgi:serine/threonine protein kinase